VVVGRDHEGEEEEEEEERAGGSWGEFFAISVAANAFLVTAIRSSL